MAIYLALFSSRQQEMPVAPWGMRSMSTMFFLVIHGGL